MAHIIGVVSQKGGVAKSTLARAIATAYAASEWTVKIADMDIHQSTSYQWQKRRLQSGIEPSVSVECFGTVSQVLKQADHYDLLIIDGSPQADRQTHEIAKAADMIVIPTGLSLDDLTPTVMLANALKQSGTPAKRICIALCRTGDSKAELEEAQDYLSQTPYHLIDGHMQEKTAFRRAQDEGRSVIECRYPKPREQADRMVQAVINRFEELTKSLNTELTNEGA